MIGGVLPKFFLYAANLHVGGAVQVAASVIDEISSRPDAEQVALLVSTQVDKNLRAAGVELGRFRDYRVADHHGIGMLFRNLRPLIGDADALLVLFGPLYQLRPPVPMVMGFAQPWIVYPDNEIYSALPFVEKCKTRLKYLLQSVFFRQAELLVVELDHVKRGVARAGIASERRIKVVHNCLAALYQQPERWKPAPRIEGSGAFKLGFIGRNYPHKNTRIFPEVRAILRRDFGIEVDMYVTFSPEEWAACTPEFREEVINVGSLTVAQCPSFYQQVDAVLFPSLLECFSATPLEAMAMKRPLFASDRPFNRDVCGDDAFYFDPLDPSSAAAVIAAYIQGRDESGVERVEKACRHVMALPGPATRATRYLDCLRQVADARNS